MIFGNAHITNILSEGPIAFTQAAVVSVTGLFLYVARRVSGGILVPILLHVGWDFSLFSGNLGENPSGSTLAGRPGDGEPGNVHHDSRDPRDQGLHTFRTTPEALLVQDESSG